MFNSPPRQRQLERLSWWNIDFRECGLASQGWTGLLSRLNHVPGFHWFGMNSLMMETVRGSGQDRNHRNGPWAALKHEDIMPSCPICCQRTGPFVVILNRSCRVPWPVHDLCEVWLLCVICPRGVCYRPTWVGAWICHSFWVNSCSKLLDHCFSIASDGLPLHHS